MQALEGRSSFHEDVRHLLRIGADINPLCKGQTGTGGIAGLFDPMGRNPFYRENRPQQ